MGFSSLTIDDFLDRLASADPTPGGGALAPLAAAFAAAMLTMVANLTHGRPRFAHVQAQASELLDRSAQLRARLLALADADAQAYAAVRDAYRLPQTTDQEKQARAEAIEASLHRATEVPVQSAEEARALADLAFTAAEIGNPALLADVAVAIHLAAGAVRAAAAQAQYNLASLQDRDFCTVMQERIDRAVLDLDGLTARILDTVEARMAS